MGGEMQFKKLPGNRGMVYVPAPRGGKRKHLCRDCFSCQWCGNERCRACREKACLKRNWETQEVRSEKSNDKD
jgi:hypothetical protein